MLIRCAIGHIPSILKSGEITTPIAIRSAITDSLNTLYLFIFVSFRTRKKGAA